MFSLNVDFSKNNSLISVIPAVAVLLVLGLITHLFSLDVITLGVVTSMNKTTEH